MPLGRCKHSSTTWIPGNYVTPLYKSTFEAWWNLHGADIKKQAKGKRNIKVNAQNIGFNGSVKADCRLQVCEAFDKGAAWSFWWCPMVTPINPPRRLAHAPSFKASLGHVPLQGPRLSFGLGLGFGLVLV
ncbi:unnamed protein product [Fraxinus pennsylvanica]|uniref:Uncharacterized protein n=1 Tax=Fraxinus pennsylvanica TaxID=56036 RepID=A0AAD1ZYA9_9LAMI|nr:unnamed protein product [Fraxinus pennsylvanica]